MIWNWPRRRPLLIDLALVAMILLVTTLDASHQRVHPTAALALGVAGTLTLLCRRQQPLAVLATVTLLALVITGLGVSLWPLQLGVALFTLAAAGAQGILVLAGVVSISAMAIALPAAGFDFGDLVVSRVVFLVAAWLLGGNLAARRAHLRDLEEKARRLERERTIEVERVAAQEQARIARELHDVIAHALSVIVMQAGAADDVFEVDPRRAREPIRAIDAAGRAALADLRRVLGLLQQDADYEPPPSLTRLEALIQQVCATGLQVSLEIEGPPRPLPAAVDLSAYRIVQEALTNTLKHADAERVRVRIRYAQQLGVEIRDDGRAKANGSTGGNGLIGMRERTTLLGGTVEAGPAADGGYLVTAQIPIEEPHP